MTSDQYLLNMLASLGNNPGTGMPWVCRQSRTGRGIRLHQVSEGKPGDIYGDIHDRSSRFMYATPREAIESFLADPRT